jgi:two-component system response regulator AtoC
VVARYIHGRSRRADGPFLPINVGGIPDQLLESELFGFERGAFTGADRRKPGLFELASGGTLFLDEIGEMPLHLQVKLLRVLQDRKLQRLGGAGAVPIDVRVIAATNRDLEAMVAEGAFRQDLFYRLNVVEVRLPPLRERKEDLPALAASFVRRFRARVRPDIDGLSADAVRRLSGYAFPGNVRELENLIERAMILAEGSHLEARDFPVGDSAVTEPPRGTLAELERDAIIAALQRNQGHRTETAAELGITRRTLLNKINALGLEPDKWR